MENDRPICCAVASMLQVSPREMASEVFDAMQLGDGPNFILPFQFLTAQVLK